jgi:hypothetical protein
VQGDNKETKVEEQRQGAKKRTGSKVQLINLKVNVNSKKDYFTLGLA